MPTQTPFRKKLLLFSLLLLILTSLWVFVTYEPTKKELLPTPTSTSTPLVLSTTTQTNTPRETKTYRNEEFGFEFEYPAGWEIKENPYSSPFSKFNLIIIPKNNKYLPDPVLVNVVTIDFANRASISRKNLRATISNITVGEISGTKYEYTEEFPVISIDLPFGKFHMILGAKKEYENIFNQLVASFKFTK